jgi:hypothetical protein
MKILVQKCPVPANTILENYSLNGAYADCYRTEVPRRVAFPDFIIAFYTTPLFKLERWILRLTVGKPSTDVQARELADGSRDEFAAWYVEHRKENELLMCDFRGHTRSWLMVIPTRLVSGDRTQLYFGSAVVPRQNPKTGKLTLGPGYQALLGFHTVYSVFLLYSSELHMRHYVK